MRIALIGAGRIGRLHARILAAAPGVDEVILADVVSDLAATVAAETNALASPPVGRRAVVTPAASIEAAMDEADAIAIAASTSAHGSLIKAAVGRGKPTFCEKPLEVSLEATREVADIVDASGVPFQLGFQRRFDPAYREARRMVESGDLGTLYAVRLAGHDPAPPHEAYIPQSGGLFRDFSIHDFDVLRWLTGTEVEEVYAVGAVRGFPVFAKYDDVDTAVATLRCTDGTLAVLTVARHDPLGYDIRTELFGSKDSISVGLGPRMPLRSVEPGVPPPAGPLWPNFLVRFEAAYMAELEAFIRVARGEIPSPCTARDGVAALLVAEAATRSRFEGRPVLVSEFAP